VVKRKIIRQSGDLDILKNITRSGEEPIKRR
jgi:hypothetical protein